jgi:hypothetical protein
MFGLFSGQKQAAAKLFDSFTGSITAADTKTMDRLIIHAE